MTVGTPVLMHVAGPPEHEPADCKAGWRWTQRCLRCDLELTLERFAELGTDVIETDTGAQREAGPEQHGTLERCRGE